MATSQIQWNLYRQEIYNYVNSMTIKFGTFADIIKKRIYNTTSYSLTDDRENPYYLNLIGEYDNKIFKQPTIYVKALETGSDVPFNKQLWIDYPETASLYNITTDEYKNLCLKYPDQVGLIKNIIYPVLDIDYAIQAPELTILRHEPFFLQANERESLYKAAVNFLTYMRERWFIRDFDFEDQYPIAFAAQVYSLLPLILLARRIQNLNTDAVHKMHVWDTLSENGLGDYQDVLTDVKARWLYRNINYIKNNKGRKDTLYKLADNILKDLKVTLVGKVIYQNNADIENNCTLVPEFLSEEIRNYDENKTIDTVAFESMDTIMHRLHAEGVYPDYSYVDSINKQVRFGHTQLNELQTQLLELKKYTINTTHLLRLIEFIHDTLLYQLSLHNLEYQITFKDENTALPFDLSVADSVVLLHYLLFKRFNENVIYLPKTARVRIPYLDKRPNKDTLPKTFYFNHNDYIINSCINVDKVLNDIPWLSDKTYINASDFIIDIGKQFDIYIKHNRECWESADALYQFMLTYLYKHLTVDKFIEFNISSCVTYDEWFNQHPEIKDLISAYEALPQSSLFIEEFCINLLRKILPIELSDILVNYVGSIYDDTHFYKKLKQLFVYLTSHDLEYLDTERESITYLDFGDIDCTTTAGSDDIGRDLVDLGIWIIRDRLEENFFNKENATDVDLRDSVLVEESPLEDNISIDTNLDSTNIPMGEDMPKQFGETECVLTPIDANESSSYYTNLSCGPSISFIEE